MLDNIISSLPEFKCFNLPFIDDKVTGTGISCVKKVLSGVNVGEDGDKGDDETENPDANN